MSYGFDDILPDRPSSRQSFFKINGVKVIENSIGNGRGFRLARINNDCSVNETLQFDTHLLGTQSDEIRDYLPNLPRNTRIAGITNDEYSRGLKDDAKDLLINVGLDLSSASYRSSFCFVFITGKPEQTKQSQAARHNGPSRLLVTI